MRQNNNSIAPSDVSETEEVSKRNRASYVQLVSPAAFAMSADRREDLGIEEFTPLPSDPLECMELCDTLKESTDKLVKRLANMKETMSQIIADLETIKKARLQAFRNAKDDSTES